MLWSHTVVRIEGEGNVGALKLENKKDGSHRTLHVRGVFIAVGIRPTSALTAGQVALDEGGYVLAGEDCETSVPGVFAIGDLRKKQLRQVITACGDGANAITSVQRYLGEH